MKKLLLAFILSLALIVSSCSWNPGKIDVSDKNKNAITGNSAQVSNGTGITKHPHEANFNRGKLASLPSYDPNPENQWKMDLRSSDLSELDIKDRFNDLIYADFDSKTIWPQGLPNEYNPAKIMELGKSPGLNINELHKKNITGKGVGIAVIDQALLVDHSEYKDNLKLYEEIHWPDNEAQMHGPAVASIAVGKSVGVAPDADLYYIAELHGEYVNNTFEWDFTWLAKSIDRILEINKTLPDGKKIRVISISVGWSEKQKGYEEVTAAVERAKKQGIFVVSSSLYETYGYFLLGLGREPFGDPNKFSSYLPGIFWADEFYKSDGYKTLKEQYKINDILMVPMDSRTTASPTGKDDYVFYRIGGLSWSIPYIAGLYALACHVKPDITPDLFLSEALNTGETVIVKNNGKEYSLGKIVNPVKLMDALK